MSPVTYYLQVFEAAWRLVVEQLRSIQSDLKQESNLVNFSINLYIIAEVKSLFLIHKNLSKATRF